MFQGELRFYYHIPIVKSLTRLLEDSQLRRNIVIPYYNKPEHMMSGHRGFQDGAVFTSLNINGMYGKTVLKLLLNNKCDHHKEKCLIALNICTNIGQKLQKGFVQLNIATMASLFIQSFFP